MSGSANRPHSQLPRGVTRGLWDYAHSHPIADDYDDYFAFNRLFDFDARILRDVLGESGDGRLVADLGCGTGRALLPLAERGFRGLAVDLSQRMLERVRQKASQKNLPIDCLRANLAQLDAVADNSVDHAISLFSTLGMIQGQAHRAAALRHTRRILRPGGKFVLHVHNFWFNLYDPGGPWWLLRNLVQSCYRADVERGDKYFPYRGLATMYLHVFTRRELCRLIRQSGFQLQQLIPLDPQRHRRLRWAGMLPQLRANGYLAVCD